MNMYFALKKVFHPNFHYPKLCSTYMCLDPGGWQDKYHKIPLFAESASMYSCIYFAVDSSAVGIEPFLKIVFEVNFRRGF